MPPTCRYLPGLLFVATQFLAWHVCAATPKDLLNSNRLAKVVKADETQMAALTGYAQALTRAVARYQWRKAKRTCEATLWLGRSPDVRELHELRKASRKQIDAILDSLKSGLGPKQVKRIDRVLKGKKNILDVKVSDLPFHHINNTPLFTRFHSRGKAYRTSIPGTPSSDYAWSYADLLSTWTVRGFISSVRPVDAMHREPGITEHPNVRVQELPRSTHARLVASPLLLAATLMVPDLNRAEFELLRDHYSQDEGGEETGWAQYREQNRFEDAILVRLKMSTPYSQRYLDMDRWIIYLEDSEGTGYEPDQIKEEALHPLEAIEISLPGREAEITDVFGNYYPYVPYHKEIVYLEAPAKVTYTGQEKLVKLFFPGRDFLGHPVVTNQTKYLKLIVQAQAEDDSRAELVWEMNHPRPRKP